MANKLFRVMEGNSQFSKAKNRLTALEIKSLGVNMCMFNRLITQCPQEGTASTHG